MPNAVSRLNVSKEATEASEDERANASKVEVVAEVERNFERVASDEKGALAKSRRRDHL